MGEEILKGILKGKYSDGHAVLIDGVWYEVEKKDQELVKQIAKDSEISFKMKEEGKKRYITNITVEGGTKAPEKTKEAYKKTYTKSGTSERSNEYWDKKDKVLNRQGALRCASIAIRALGEVSDVDALESIVITLAKKFEKYTTG